MNSGTWRDRRGLQGGTFEDQVGHAIARTVYCFSMQSLPPIESLECFLVASSRLNFAKAASSINLSPAAFGQRIRQLEEYVGNALFIRTTRTVELTAAGERLIPKVEAILDSASSLPALARDEGVVVERSMTIGTRHELGLSWLTPLLPRLERAVPGLTLHLHFGSGDGIVGGVEEGSLDAAVCSIRLSDSKFAFELLHEESYQLVGSPKLLDDHPIPNLGALVDHTLIDTNAALPLARYWLDADAERMHLQFQRLRYLGTIGAIRSLVLRGLGVAVLPSYFVGRDLKSGRLMPILPKKKVLTDHFRLLYSSKSRDTEVFATLAHVMRDTPLR